jgi:hypothetical protein
MLRAVVTNRRNLTPPSPPGDEQADGKHAMRRGGARHEASDRVWLRGDDGSVHEGWALNVSRGGLRAILEEKVDVGQEFDVTVGDLEATPRRGRVVWLQEEPDGMIVGVEFVGLSGTFKSVPPSDMPMPPTSDKNDPA